MSVAAVRYAATVYGDTQHLVIPDLKKVWVSGCKRAFRDNQVTTYPVGRRGKVFQTCQRCRSVFTEPEHA